jgi:hypothetical protein
MEGHCSTGQSPLRAVEPMEEEEEEEEEEILDKQSFFIGMQPATSHYFFMCQSSV